MVGVEEFENVPRGTGNVASVFVMQSLDIIFVNGGDEEIFQCSVCVLLHSVKILMLA